MVWFEYKIDTPVKQAATKIKEMSSPVHTWNVHFGKVTSLI